MDEDSGQLAPNLLGAIEAQLVEEAKAKIARDMAEIARLASTYPGALKALASQMGLTDKAKIAPPKSDTKPSDLETMGNLIEQYQTAPASPIHALKHNSRGHYETILRLIGNDYSWQRISEMDGDTLDRWYAKWREGGKIAVAHSKMTMLRNLFSFGIMLARDEDCARLFGLIGKMQIELPKVRKEHLTREQASLIRAKAHERKRPSIALAQAFQSDVGMTQKDVIGEWVPVSEPGISDVINGGMKWLRGLRWEGVDPNKLTLTHSVGGKQITVDLRQHPMVMEELEHVRKKYAGLLPIRGAIIVSEWDGLPWDAVEFRRWWRVLAKECEIPDTVRNTDSRVKARNRAQEAAPIAENKSGSIFD